MIGRHDSMSWQIRRTEKRPKATRVDDWVYSLVFFPLHLCNKLKARKTTQKARLFLSQTPESLGKKKGTNGEKKQGITCERKTQGNQKKQGKESGVSKKESGVSKGGSCVGGGGNLNNWGHPQTCDYPDVCLRTDIVSGKLPLLGRQGIWWIPLPFLLVPRNLWGGRADTSCIYPAPCPGRGALPDTSPISKHTSG